MCSWPPELTPEQVVNEIKAVCNMLSSCQTFLFITEPVKTADMISVAKVPLATVIIRSCSHKTLNIHVILNGAPLRDESRRR